MFKQMLYLILTIGFSLLPSGSLVSQGDSKQDKKNKICYSYKLIVGAFCKLSDVFIRNFKIFTNLSKPADILVYQRGIAGLQV